MKTAAAAFVRRSIMVAAIGVLLVVLAACRGIGGGNLPPGLTHSDLFPTTVFTGQASFGFAFKCERSELQIQLSYTDHGGSLLLGSPFSIHGIVDVIDPVLESMICIGQNPPPPPENQLIFLGRYFRTSSAPPGFPASCPTRETPTTPLCRFEVIVQDNDHNNTPSMGDFFSIKLSSSTVLSSQLDPATVFYARAGFLAGGNLTVK